MDEGNKQMDITRIRIAKGSEDFKGYLEAELVAAGCMVRSEDVRWLSDNFQGYHLNVVAHILSAYVGFWAEAMEACDASHRKDSAGRFAANSWILDFWFGSGRNITEMAGQKVRETQAKQDKPGSCSLCRNFLEENITTRGFHRCQALGYVVGGWKARECEAFA